MAARTYRRFTNEGAAAFEYGLSKSKCPYVAGTQEYLHWVEGWTQADRQETIDDRRGGLVALIGGALRP